MKCNEIYIGDCINIIKNEIESESVNLVFADPPYNLSGTNLKWIGNKTGGDWFMMNEDWDKMTDDDYLNFTYDWIAECNRVLVKNGSIYVCCTYHNIGGIVRALKKSNFKINNIITWYKTNAMPNMTKRVFTHCSEFVVWAVKGKNWIFNYEDIRLYNPEKQKDGSPKQMRDVWTMPLVQGKERVRSSNGRALHATQKPEEMLRRIILASSKEGDLILDPFIGSGTTAVVASQLRRKWIGIEKNETYTIAARKRLKAIENS